MHRRYGRHSWTLAFPQENPHHGWLKAQANLSKKSIKLNIKSITQIQIFKLKRLTMNKHYILNSP